MDNLSLEINALQEFCNIIYEEITSCISTGRNYKYVYFQVDEDEMQNFFKDNKKFILGVDKVYATSEIRYEDVRKANSVYGNIIQESLAKARERFAQIDIV